MSNLTIKSMGLSTNQTSHLTELTEPEAQLSVQQNKLTPKEDKMLRKKSAQMQCPREHGPLHRTAQRQQIPPSSTKHSNTPAPTQQGQEHWEGPRRKCMCGSEIPGLP